MNMIKNSRPTYGPQLRLSDEIDTAKYRQDGEDFYSKVVRIADALKDSDEHFEDLKTFCVICVSCRAGFRTCCSRQTTAFNCFVSKS